MRRAVRPGAGGGFLFLLVGLACAAGCGDDERARVEAEIDRELAAASAPSGFGAPAESTRIASTPVEYPRAAHAKTETMRLLKSEAAAEHHATDGAGTARVETDQPVHAGGNARFVIVYEAGPRGIKPGGSVAFQVPPYWNWSPAQTTDPAAPGYTTVTSDVPGLALSTSTVEKQGVVVRIGKQPFPAFKQLRIVYGAGDAGAQADRFAEKESRFSLSVDGDGDGVRRQLYDLPTVEILPGPPTRLEMHLPGTTRPGQPVELVLAVLDPVGNTGIEFQGSIALEAPEGVRVAPQVAFRPEDLGRVRVPVVADAEGVLRIHGTGPGVLRGRSNPMRVSVARPRILFGDLHGHSNLSDGTGTPEDYYTYARDVAGLDFAALTDHDHWGRPYLDESPVARGRIRSATAVANQSERFVTFHAFEWTSWVYGHRHVLYFGGDGPWFSFLDPATETPEQLWDRLRGLPAMTLAHHSAGGPVATDWSIPPDPELEPLTEVASVHGSSEAPDSPKPIYEPVPGNFVRDVLDRGYRLGFVGSGDSHDGHPGLVHLVDGKGGLAAVFSEDLSREMLRRALVDRLAYATNGPRILLEVHLDGHEMGREIEAASLPPEARIEVDVVAEDEIERVDLVRSGVVVGSAAGRRTSELTVVDTVRDLAAGEYLYVRVVQQDGGAAWSSPFFIR